jgi:hypothetical protein
MSDRRSSEDALNPAEHLSFHRVAYGLSSAVPKDHRATLIDMGLVSIDDIGILVLTEAGWQRYERETANRGPMAPNQLDRAADD